MGRHFPYECVISRLLKALNQKKINQSYHIMQKPSGKKWAAFCTIYFRLDRTLALWYTVSILNRMAVYYG